MEAEKAEPELLVGSEQAEQGIAAGNGEDAASRRRKKLFGDCALIEIIHLHDCLRGAIKALAQDVNELCQSVANRRGDRMKADSQQYQQLLELERRVAGRFKVIWSVFRAHSSAEDEFIWPALKSKTEGRVTHHSPLDNELGVVGEPTSNPNRPMQVAATKVEEESKKSTSTETHSSTEEIEQSEYTEDHASEEIMFETIDALLAKLRKGLVEKKEGVGKDTIPDTAQALSQHMQSLARHLNQHLEKEENQCMPKVRKHLTKNEIHDLVGKIMGKRSSDLIAQIMTMAVQNLTDHERDEMIKYMKQAMEGTFFDRWLLMSGWMQSPKEEEELEGKQESDAATGGIISSVAAVKSDTHNKPPPTATESKKRPAKDCHHDAAVDNDVKKPHLEATEAVPKDAKQRSCFDGANITGQAELERLIRAVASNSSLTPIQKNTTIQGLRDSVWKSNQKQRETGGGQSAHDFAPQASVVTRDVGSSAVSTTGIKLRRATPPSVYLKRDDKGKVELAWSSDSPTARYPNEDSVPLFSAAELAPTYHDGATGAVLGCPHYARACKLRHPTSGRLYTCRLCCEQERDMPMKDKDEPLDRYAVTEVMCMKCNALQPVDDRCHNPQCESHGKPFAKYFCRICHLYDDRSRPIFHCPYCNTCRMGLGLGIDFRHCMRCNACVSLADEDHRCIPQKLQGSCPICHESMFSSTEPLRGLKCGHALHLSCYTMYRRDSYICPLCQRSMEDMSDHFALLDAACRMQPMPNSYLSTVSNIYCQDCGKTGQVQYHFVGQKCPCCGSYNTREMARVQNRQALEAEAPR